MDEKMDEKIVALLTALVSSGIIATIVGYMFTRRNKAAEAEKVEAEADAMQTTIRLSLIKPLEDRIAGQEKQLGVMIERMSVANCRIDILENENRQLTRENIDMRDRIRRLEAQIVSMKGTPVE